MIKITGVITFLHYPIYIYINHFVVIFFITINITVVVIIMIIIVIISLP